MKVSCVMPVCGRLDFTKKAIEYFLRQTETSSELIIVDDAGAPTWDAFAPYADSARVFYIEANQPTMPAGPKRNIGTQIAAGDYVLHWDDDDWYAPTRIEHQLARLTDGVDITWMPNAASLYLENGTCWRPRRESHWLTDGTVVLGGSLAYRREVWDAGTRYEHRTYADEEHFCRDARRAGFKQERDVTPDQWMIVRHGNHGRKHRPGPSMERVEPHYVPEEDMAFYRDRMPLTLL